MTEDIKPYPKYKDSGVPWLGEVPEHWEMRPSFGIFAPIHERNRGMKEKTVLSLSYGRIIVKPEDKLRGLVPESFETYQIVNPGDIVIRTTDLQNDHTSLRVGAVHTRGIITSAYLALKVLHGIIPEFGFQLLNVWDLTKAIYGYGSGLRQNLDFSHFKRMPLAVPPPEEQAAIVRFLEVADRRIQKYIRAKQRLIALLNEQKQAIIQRAVTQGLNPDAPKKPSGIPWLGDIPAHWERLPLIRIGRIGNGSTPSRANRSYWEGGTYPWLNSSQVNRCAIGNATQFVTATALRECHLPIVPSGSVLVAITGQGKTRGTAALLGIEATINQHLAYIAPNNALVSPEFLRLALVGAYLELRAMSDDSGSTKGALTCEALKRFKIAVPPPNEQRSVIDWINSHLKTANSTLHRVEREIGLLKEYRTRLIADVVTGKLDVRKATERLSLGDLTDNSPTEIRAELDESEAEYDAVEEFV